MVFDLLGDKIKQMFGDDTESHGASLPEPLDAVLIERRINADDWHTLHTRLGNKQPVEWVPVMSGESRQDIGIFYGNWEDVHPEVSHGLRNPRAVWQR